MSDAAGPQPAAAPIIVTALFGDADFAWLDAQRRAHFPPERNLLSAHLTLFHHLAPSLAGELAAVLRHETRHVEPPEATIDRVLPLGRGTAYGVRSPDLAAIRARIADRFAPMLTPQDAAGWRPHVTIQNKVDPAVARALQAEITQSFAPRPLAIVGLASFYYRGGPWEPIARYTFSRSGRSRRN